MHDVGKSGWYILIPIYNLVLACTFSGSFSKSIGAAITSYIAVKSTVAAVGSPVQIIVLPATILNGLFPKGATVKNLEKFNMSHKTDINGKTEATFVSNYKTQGDEILIENTEYYNIINYPLEHFDSYKAVINAAADFNKIVIVLNQ